VPATKPVPTISTIVAVDPAFNALGERDAIVGASSAAGLRVHCIQQQGRSA
jgi:hypothetical protein